MGYPIPSSSTVTVLSTAVTVPQVQFTTAASVAGTTASVGLAPAVTIVPAGGAKTTPVQATATATGILTATGFGTTYVPSKTSSSGIVMATVNAAGRVGSGSVVGMLAGGALAMLAL
jgi:hypothetical protein